MTQPIPSLPEPIDHTHSITLLTELAEIAMDQVRKAAAGADQTRAAPPPPETARRPDPLFAFNRLAGTVARILALKARLQQQHHEGVTATATDQIRSAHRAAAAVADAERDRKARAHRHMGRMISRAIASPLNEGRTPPQRVSPLLNFAEFDRALEHHSICELVVIFCRDLGILPDFSAWTPAELAEIDAEHRPPNATYPAKTNTPQPDLRPAPEPATIDTG